MTASQGLDRNSPLTFPLSGMIFETLMFPADKKVLSSTACIIIIDNRAVFFSNTQPVSGHHLYFNKVLCGKKLL